MKLINYTIKQLLNSGVHIGRHLDLYNPFAYFYVLGSRNKNTLINLKYSLFSIKRIINFVTLLSYWRGNIVIINNDNTYYKISNEIISSNVIDNKLFITKYWIGGLLTNFRIVRNNKNINNKLKLKFNCIPDVTFSMTCYSNLTAINECKKLKVPIIGVLDSWSDPFEIEYPLYGNDQSISSYSLYIHLLIFALKNGLLKEKLLMKS